MDEIKLIKKDGDMLTLAASREYLQKLIDFYRKADPIGELFHNLPYENLKDLANSLERIMQERPEDPVIFEAKSDYFFDEPLDAFGRAINAAATQIVESHFNTTKDYLKKTEEPLYSLFRLIYH